MTIHLTEEERNFVAADKSDPFTAGRIRAHIAIGIVEKRVKGDCNYSAKKQELGDGRVLYSEMVRP